MNRKVIGLFSLLFYCLSVSGHISAKSVFVIDSYHASFPWTSVCRKGFTENINPAYDVKFFELDTKRIDDSELTIRTERIWQEIKAQKPEIVVTMDDSALKLLGQRVADEGIPLVFMGVNNEPRRYFENSILPGNVTGIVERPHFKACTTTISRLVPMKHKRILIMMDDGTTSRTFINHAFGGSEEVAFHDDIIMSIWMTDSYANWQEKVETLAVSDYDALIIGSYSRIRDKENNRVFDKTILEWTSANSKIPLFTLWGHAVGKGKAIGGVIISGCDQGKQGALAVNQILEKGTVPYVEFPRHGEFLFSKSELERWNIKLPAYLKQRAILVD